MEARRLIRTSPICPFSAENFMRHVSLILGFQESGEVRSRTIKTNSESDDKFSCRRSVHIIEYYICRLHHQ